ncbi:hypothetical protein QIA37_05240 (plasmid) [Borrelia sp. CA_690]|uniref:hypothetical protein n=1 Tax=Borrelia TaxID=138 RepID=UPI001E64FF93|nr:hypothetical protein [Borrelia maritima]
MFLKIKLKLGNNVFENKIFIFYLCISDVSFFKLLYLLDRNSFDDCNIDNFDDWPILIYQKFREIKKSLELILCSDSE